MNSNTASSRCSYISLRLRRPRPTLRIHTHFMCSCTIWKSRYLAIHIYRTNTSWFYPSI